MRMICIVEATGLNARYKKPSLSVLWVSNKCSFRTMPREKAQRLKTECK